MSGITTGVVADADLELLPVTTTGVIGSSIASWFDDGFDEELFGVNGARPGVVGSWVSLVRFCERELPVMTVGVIGWGFS